MKAKILVVITGSIAAFKAAALVSKLKQRGHQVRVVLTASAQRFIGEATLEGLTQEKVYMDLYESGSMMAHINLDRWADLVLVSPATAHYINRISSGFAEDLAANIFLAHDFSKPFVLAPAMNTKMYLHPTTQKSLKNLRAMGVEVLETASGVLACGEEGYGRLLEPDLIVEEVERLLPLLKKSDPSSEKTGKPRAPKRILITAGSMETPLDAVRSVVNSSTGRTGFELAQYFDSLGFQVTLLLAQSSRYWEQIKGFGFSAKSYRTYEDLENQLKIELKSPYDFVFMAAAVSDYKISKVEIGSKKIKVTAKWPSGRKLKVHLEPRPKLIAKIKPWSKSSPVLVGFKLTADQDPSEIRSSVEKLALEAQADYVIHNSWEDLGDQTHPVRVFDFVHEAEPKPFLSPLAAADYVISQNQKKKRRLL